MRSSLKWIVRSLSLYLFLVYPQRYAEAQGQGNSTDSLSGPFVKNRLSAQLVTGALFGSVSWVHDHATFNYAQTNLRLGWMASEPAESKHEGEEFVYVLSGEAEITVEQKTTKLGEKQSLRFNSNLDHHLSNPGEGEAELLIILYLP